VLPVIPFGTWGLAYGFPELIVEHFYVLAMLAGFVLEISCGRTDKQTEVKP